MNTFEKILYDSMVEITNTNCNVIITVSRLKSNTKENKVHKVFGNDFVQLLWWYIYRMRISKLGDGPSQQIYHAIDSYIVAQNSKKLYVKCNVAINNQNSNTNDIKDKKI